MTRPGPTSVLQSGSVYLLTVGGFIGEGNDHFASHPLNGMKFSTPDNDNDQVTVQLMTRVDGGTI